ncbi:MAG: phage holin family protein [Thermoanaerobaculia bacterium]
MGKRISSWVELFQSLQEAFIGVVQAEVSALRLDFELSKRRLVRAIGLAAAAIFVIFWAIGVVVFLLIQVAGQWLPLWAAALVVLALLVIAGVALVAAARGSLQQIEAPKAMIRRHVQESMDWWEDEIMPTSDVEKKGSLPAGDIPPERDQESP